MGLAKMFQTQSYGGKGSGGVTLGRFVENVVIGNIGQKLLDLFLVVLSGSDVYIFLGS